MSVNFSIESISEKPQRKGRGRQGSRYVPIIEAFLKSDHRLVQVDNTGKEANYLALNLNKIIKKQGEAIKVSVRNGKVYLEK